MRQKKCVLIVILGIFCCFGIANGQTIPTFDYVIIFNIPSMSAKVIQDNYIMETHRLYNRTLTIGGVISGETMDRFWGLLEDENGNVIWDLIGNIIWNNRNVNQLTGTKGYIQGSFIYPSADVQILAGNYIDGTISHNKKGYSVKVKAGVNATYAPQYGYGYIAIYNSISGKGNLY